MNIKLLLILVNLLWFKKMLVNLKQLLLKSIWAKYSEILSKSSAAVAYDYISLGRKLVVAAVSVMRKSASFITLLKF